MPKAKKVIKKKIAKKSASKPVKKVVVVKKQKPVRRGLRVSLSRTPQGKPIGKVTHFYGEIKVGILKFSKPVKVGVEIEIKGATTDFSQKIKSMQYDHKEIPAAKKGQEVGIKMEDKVREGDEVFEIKK